MKTKTKLIVLAVVIAAAAFYFLNPFGGETAQATYRTQRVISNQLRIAVSATGTLNPVRVVSVGTQISGTIREINADFNDEVKEGQTLVKLDDELFRAKVQMAEANLASAEAQHDLAMIRFARQEKLYSSRAAPKEELDTAAANLAMAEAAVAQHRAQLAQDRYNLNNTVINSPVDGVVTNRAVDVGQTVAASFQTPTLITIAQDLTKMQINASFAEADIGRLTPGLKATFTVDAYPGVTFNGVLRQIRLNPTVASNVVTYDVVVDVDNADQRLLPGMTAYVDIELYREDGAVLVPNAALNFRPGGGAALPLGADVQGAAAGGGASGGQGGAAGASGGQGSAAGSQGPEGRAAAESGQGSGSPAGEAPEGGGEAAASGTGASGSGASGSGTSASALAALVIPSKDDPPGQGRVYILDREGRPVAIDILTGATDLRYTVLKGGPLKPGDQVITSETAPAAQAQGTLFGSGRSGGARPGPRPF
ncbi:MAG: efflux RND transporter periplasmic adaptor subunit [Deltaproteobacteria bacterium]|jgi:HlyD family secretion protein|nr:efflux RND transporter periplasmic adaptor subunit [Deltaproteobacteria bacterium]